MTDSNLQSLSKTLDDMKAIALSNAFRNPAQEKTNELELAVRAVRIYAESHPRPLHVTQTQAAEMLDRSRETVRRMIAAGNLTLNDFGLIPIGQIDRALNAHGIYRNRRR